MSKIIHEMWMKKGAARSVVNGRVSAEREDELRSY